MQNIDINKVTDIAIYVLIGVAVAIVVYYKLKERQKIKTKGIKVEGVVFEVVMDAQLNVTFGDLDDNCSTNQNCYCPVVRYLTLEKEWITKKYYIGHYPSKYKEGDIVTILYDPDDPKKFIIDGKS